MKRSTVQKLREMCPNIGIVEKVISWARKYQLTHGTMTPAEIQAAEKSLDMRKKAIATYRKPAELQRLDSSISDIFENAPQYIGKSQAELDAIRTDMKFCYVAYGVVPYEYLCFEFEGKDYAYRNEFISARDHDVYQSVLNNVVESAVLIDKSKTYEKFKEYYRRDAVTIASAKDADAFSRFVEKHPVFVRKAVYAGCGNSIERVDSTTYPGGVKKLFDDILQSGKTIAEELLVQHDSMKALNASSVNTVRLVTIATAGGGVRPIYAFARIGRDGSFVDNGRALGILVGVNIQTGVMETDGWDEHNVRYPVHPDSGVPLKGFQMPEWDQLLSVAETCSKMLLPGMNSASWDFAYARSEECPDFSWSMVEGNPLGEFFAQQETVKRGLKREMEEMIRDCKTSIRL